VGRAVNAELTLVWHPDAIDVCDYAGEMCAAPGDWSVNWQDAPLEIPMRVCCRHLLPVAQAMARQAVAQ
jgi:hypothetical protein